MLYERWREIAREHRHEIALQDLASDQHWTFRELSLISEAPSHSPDSKSKFAFPRGSRADFIFTVLQAWRAGQIVCPLEADQLAPSFLAELPANVKQALRWRCRRWEMRHDCS